MEEAIIQLRLAVSELTGRVARLEIEGAALQSRLADRDEAIEERYLAKEAFDPYRLFNVSLAGLVFLTVGGLILKMLFTGIPGLSGLVGR